MAKTNKRLAVFQKKIKLYKKDPVLFCKEVTQFIPEPYQEQLLMDLATSTKVGIKSGHGIGKTATEANAVLWFLTCFPYARVVATAPTAQQLNDVLWAELNKWISRSPLLQEILKWTKTYVYIKGYERRWFAVAKTASKPENMQGFHEDNLLFIVDEASGVEDEIMEAVLATLSGENNKLMMCGNPTRTSGTFYDAFHADRALYKTQTVSSLDSRRTNKENIAMLRHKYGENSNFYRVRVLGEFPTQEDDVFIPLPLIEKSVITEIPIDSISKITIGVDVARFGNDETVICQNVNGRISIPKTRIGQNLMSTVGDIVMTYKTIIKDYPQYTGTITVNIDDTGLGGGVTDRLNEVKLEEKLYRMEIVPVNFGQSAPKNEKGEICANIATYMWHTIRDLMQCCQISIENDEDMVAQLSVRKYSITSKGKILLESKDDMKKRGIRSPDRADALALSCFTENKVYSSFIDTIQNLIISEEAIKTTPILQINIGISIGDALSGTSMVATAITSNYQKVIVLESRKFVGLIETEDLGNLFLQFAKSINSRYNKISYCYVDQNEKFLYRCIKNSVMRSNLSATVRIAANDSIANRVMLTTRLISQNRFFITENCNSLVTAFSETVWNDKTIEKNRVSSDPGTLNAFEYTIEREATRFLNSH